MPNRNYEAGRRFEYARKKHWESLGYMVLRTAGSHGAFDLVALAPSGSVLLIQCKRVAKHSEAKRLLEDFKTNPPLPMRSRTGPTQIMEVWVKETRSVLDWWM